MVQNFSKSSFFIFSGEPSGDLYGAHLVDSMRALNPEVDFLGVPGPEMRQRHVKPFLAMENFKVMGFTDVLLAFPKLLKNYFMIKKEILLQQPETVILIDSPAFNLRLAKGLRKRGFKGKIVQYISPSVWAHGKKRIDHMASTLDLLLTIFPFESSFFKQVPLDVRYVGNPLSEIISKYSYQKEWRQFFGLPAERPILGLFPGSREGEIKRNFPIQLAASEKLAQENPFLLVAVSVADHSMKELLEVLISQTTLKKENRIFLIPNNFTYELMRDCHTAIAKSGTVTLELALHCVPTVVMYQLTTLNRLIAKHILRVNLTHYCIVNILGDKEVFPELIASGLTIENLFNEVKKIFFNGLEREKCYSGCEEIQKLLELQGESPSMKAAKAILGCQTC